MILRFVVWVSLPLFSSLAFADTKEFLYRRHLKSVLEKSIAYESSNISDFSKRTHASTFQQKINHLDSTDSRTFLQRFFINDEFAIDKRNAPVFFNVCGEGPCSINDLSGLIAQMAKEHGAIMVTLEHRYYGKSHPFVNMSTDSLQYLSVEQALLDIASFQDYLFEHKGYSKKWVLIGSSYSGSLAAYFRQKFPERSLGALASSAPVQAKEKFEEYDAHVAKTLRPKCASLARDVIRKVEQSLQTQAGRQEIKLTMHAPELENDDDFLYFVADMAALAAQYGYRDDFCNRVETTDGSLVGYASFVKKILSEWEMTALDESAQGASSENPPTEATADMRAWFYQSCTEFGFWQIANASPEKSVKSPRTNLEYHHNICRRLFNIEPRSMDVVTNYRYYYPLLNQETTNIFFTNGSNDPWMNLSIFGQESPFNPNIYSYVIEGASHCSDMAGLRKSNSTALDIAIERFRILLSSWL